MKRSSLKTFAVFLGIVTLLILLIFFIIIYATVLNYLPKKPFELVIIGFISIIAAVVLFSLILFPIPKNIRLTYGIKILMDRICAVVSLLVLSPFFILVSFLIKLSSRGPVLYKHRVIGYMQKPFISYKFRTMIASGESITWMKQSPDKEPMYKMRSDLRITPIGKFLRKSSIDELPQLINVLKGEMSLVGPRAISPYEASSYDEQMSKRFSMLPGITGLWQVEGRHNFEQMILYDEEYIHNWSLWLDFKILFKSISVVIRESGSY